MNLLLLSIFSFIFVQPTVHSAIGKSEPSLTSSRKVPFVYVLESTVPL